MDGQIEDSTLDQTSEIGKGADNNLSSISIFGLGYVGAVSTACFANRGHKVIGVDPDPNKIQLINSGKSPIVEPGLNDLLKQCVSKSRIHATDDPIWAVMNTDISFVCVGTPSTDDGRCDLRYLEQVSTSIGMALRHKDEYHTVIFRSTVPPGTTATVMCTIIEKASGKKAGPDFGLGFHPEFLRESTAIADFNEPPKTVVGGIDQRTCQIVASLYQGIDDEVIETSIEAAEMVKYVDNTWHALKVSFANEIGKICRAAHVDSHDVMDIFVQDTKLNLSPYYMKPGFAFGGSCLPKDVRGINHLAMDLGVSTPVLGSIIASNQAQIDHACKIIQETNPKVIAFLGVTFKADTDDLRESPVIPLIDDLLRKRYQIQIYDKNLNLETSVRHHQEHSRHENKDDDDNLMAQLPKLVCESAQIACKGADTIVVTHNDPLFRKIITSRKPEQKVVDLVRIFEHQQGWPEMAYAGMDDYVQKPARLTDIKEKLDLWVRKTQIKKLSILVAEDDPANAAVITAYLKKWAITYKW